MVTFMLLLPDQRLVHFEVIPCLVSFLQSTTQYFCICSPFLYSQTSFSHLWLSGCLVSLPTATSAPMVMTWSQFRHRSGRLVTAHLCFGDPEAIWLLTNATLVSVTMHMIAITSNDPAKTRNSDIFHCHQI